MQNTIACSSKSAPGPDGIPFAAWHAGGYAYAKTLYLIGERQLQGIPLCISFNDSLALFPPKGNDPEDDLQVIRSPDCTRPLGLKNSDNKTVSAVMTRSMARSMKALTHRTQRGFVPDRQMLTNVVDLDAAGRIMG